MSTVQRRPILVARGYYGATWGNGGKAMTAILHVWAIGAIGIVATCEFVSHVLHAVGTLW